MIALCWSALAATLCAQALPSGPPDRFLFLVETSEPMHPRLTAALRAIETLLVSGMHGQMRPGETLGVWTYNEDLRAGELPLQVWTPQTALLVTSNVMAFLKSQPCEKTGRLSVVWPELEELVRDSPRLTVIWVTSGGEPIRGTPFDAQINEVFSAHARAQERARMPFVIVLRAQQGAFCGVTLNLPPWPVLLPSFPPWIARAKPPEPPAVPKPAPKTAEAKPAEKSAPATAPAVPTRAEPIVRPPLIIVGKKDEPPAAPAPPPGSGPAKPAEPPPGGEEQKPSPAAALAGAQTSPPIAPVEPATKPPPAPTEPTAPAPPAPLAAPPTPAPAHTPSDQRAKTPLAELAAPAPTPSAPPITTPARETKPLPPPPAPSAPETGAAVPSGPPSSQPTSALATATPSEATGKSLWWAWLAGGIFATGALVLWLRMRRSRAPRASLITRSMDANRRPPP